MNPYRVIFEQAEVLIFVAAAALILIAWILWSSRKLYALITDTRASWRKWETYPVPDTRAVWHIVVILVLIAVDLFILGGYIYAVRSGFF